MKKAITGLVWLIFFGLLIYSLFRTEQWILNGTIILGWFLLAVQLTVNHFEKVYLLLNRAWFCFFNHACIWNMHIIYNGSFDRTVHEKIEQLLTQKNYKFSIDPISNLRRTYKFGPIKIQASVNEEEGTIIFVVEDMLVGYRDSRNLIEKELAKIFELFQTHLKPDSGKYGLVVEFKGYNPYFGFFVRRLNAKDVQGFNVTFKIDNDRVAVTKNSIEINTDSWQQLSYLSKQYLALSPAR